MKVAKNKTVVWSSKPVGIIPGVALKDYQTETAFQIYAVTWLRKQYILTRDTMFDKWHHSANERIGAKFGLKARLMGQSKGMPDLLHFGGKMAIELKIPGNDASHLQKEWLMHFRELGWYTEVIFTIDRFQELILTRYRNSKLS